MAAGQGPAGGREGLQVLEKGARQGPGPRKLAALSWPDPPGRVEPLTVRAGRDLGVMSTFSPGPAAPGGWAVAQSHGMAAQGLDWNLGLLPLSSVLS